MFSVKFNFNGEVRRSQISSSGYSFEATERLARSLFGIERPIKFTWKDDEGDSICCSTDEELAEAFRVMAEEGKKAFKFDIGLLSDGDGGDNDGEEEEDRERKAVEGGVSTSQDSAAAAGTGVGVVVGTVASGFCREPVNTSVHVGVTCDNCGVCPIIGTRYKCGVRDNFDLCCKCESSAPQPYAMMKIYTPEHAPAGMFVTLNSDAPVLPHPHLPPPYHPHPHPHQQHQHQQQYMHPPPPPPPHHYGSGGGRGGGGGRGHPGRGMGGGGGCGGGGGGGGRGGTGVGTGVGVGGTGCLPPGRGSWFGFRSNNHNNNSSSSSGGCGGSGSGGNTAGQMYGQAQGHTSSGYSPIPPTSPSPSSSSQYYPPSTSNTTSMPPPQQQLLQGPPGFGPHGPPHCPKSNPPCPSLSLRYPTTTTSTSPTSPSSTPTTAPAAAAASSHSDCPLLGRRPTRQERQEIKALKQEVRQALKEEVKQECRWRRACLGTAAASSSNCNGTGTGTGIDNNAPGVHTFDTIAQAFKASCPFFFNRPCTDDEVNQQMLDEALRLSLADPTLYTDPSTGTTSGSCVGNNTPKGSGSGSGSGSGCPSEAIVVNASCWRPTSCTGSSSSSSSSSSQSSSSIPVAHATIATAIPCPISVSNASGCNGTGTATATATVSTPSTGKLMARFVRDITFPDGTCVPPRSSLLKTWRVRNDGAVAWPEGVALVCSGGDLLTASDLSVPVPAASAGEEIEISVQVTVPELTGRHVAYFRLRTREASFFGQRMWIDIRVTEEESEWQVVSGILSTSVTRSTGASASAGASASSVPTPSPSSPQDIIVEVEEEVEAGEERGGAVEEEVEEDPDSMSVLWKKELGVLSDMGFNAESGFPIEELVPLLVECAVVPVSQQPELKGVPKPDGMQRVVMLLLYRSGAMQP